MKILLLADEADPMLWDHLDRRRLEDIDLVLSCGDLPASYLSFLTCFTTAPILYIHGNHDDNYAKQPPEGCICIEDTIYVHEGIRILGLGGSMRYSRGINQYTERQMKRRVRKLWFQLWRHKGIDILLTHSPAYQLGDDPNLAHTGFSVFLDLIDKYQPRLLAHGHVHQSYHYDFNRIRHRGDTLVLNAYGSYILDWPSLKEVKPIS